MYYEELNYEHKKFINQNIKKEIEFDWIDKEIMDTIVKLFRPLYSIDDKDSAVVQNFNSNFNKLYQRKITSKTFLKNIKELCITANSFQRRYDYKNYEKRISMSHHLLISGEGGIGKTFFLYKLEKKLEEGNINHLCLYGKYLSNISNELKKELLAMRKEFYLIIDAYNELSETNQREILKFISLLKNKKKMNIIISYRSGKLKKDIEKNLIELLNNKYLFKGVEYESSLEKLINRYGIEITKYIDVLDINNPFYLHMLNEVLIEKKLRKNQIPDLTKITFIMEQYIKNTCNISTWNCTKKLCEYLYEKGKIYFTEKDLEKIFGENNYDFVNNLIEYDLITNYISDNEEIYAFKIQKMAEYLIARSFYNDMDNLSKRKIAKLAEEKMKKNYSLREPIIVAIFDKYKEKNLKKAIDIVNMIDFDIEIDAQAIKKIFFTKEQIRKIQKKTVVSDWQNLFLEFGGNPNCPFNCSNYFNAFLINNEKEQKHIYTRFNKHDYVIKLRNILYSISILNSDENTLNEYFYYALWLSSSQNNIVRKISMKIMYEIAYKHKEFINKMRRIYKKVSEIYIKKAIIQVVSSLEKNRSTRTFLKKIYMDKDVFDAEIISRISEYLNDKNYLFLEKVNLYEKLDDSIKVDKKLDFNRILYMADTYEKNCLKFDRFSEKNTLTMYDNFILNSPIEILKYNKKLAEELKCIKNNGYCKYSMSKSLFNSHIEQPKILKIDEKKMFILFQEIYKHISEIYEYSFENETFYKWDDFNNSLLKKVLLIAQDYLLGTLMCNYYTSEFSIYNDEITLGFKPYKHFEEDEQSFNICTPIGKYNETIDGINAKLLKSTSIYGEKSKSWFNNVQMSIDNCIKLTSKITYNSVNWRLISGDVHLYIKEGDLGDTCSESYNICLGIDSRTTLKKENEKRRLTIDREKYCKCMKDYIKTKKYKCVNVPAIDSGSDVFRETNLALPPSKLINLLNLKYDEYNSIWKDKNKTVILCDNNEKHYYKNVITNAVYIEEEYLKKVEMNHDIKYWIYTEKYHKQYNWNEEAALHLEIDLHGNILYKVKNTDSNVRDKFNRKCNNCKYGLAPKNEMELCEFDFENNILDILKVEEK